MILRPRALQSAISPKRAPNSLDGAFCALFVESALFSLFGDDLKSVERFRDLGRRKVRFC